MSTKADPVRSLICGTQLFHKAPSSRPCIYMVDKDARGISIAALLRIGARKISTAAHISQCCWKSTSKEEEIHAWKHLLYNRCYRRGVVYSRLFGIALRLPTSPTDEAETKFRCFVCLKTACIQPRSCFDYDTSDTCRPRNASVCCEINPR